MSLEMPLVLRTCQTRDKAASSVCGGRAEMGQDRVRGAGLQHGYLRASSWVHTWAKTLSTEPSALTCRQTGCEVRSNAAGWGP